MREAVALLAGGAQRRFPGKLERELRGKPLMLHAFETVRASGYPVYVCGKATFAPELDAALDAPLIVDRFPGEGPLSALLGACELIPAERIFAIAADMPRLPADHLERLAAEMQPGDEAVVPQHEGGIEPLAALYDRAALLRVGQELHRSGRSSMRDAIARLATRFVREERRHFLNVNHPADLADEEATT
ncbi:MAG TPA: molybdenum cofactor guanylyltransferase [Candidatus Cybelea sp.]|jgi:molybdopterin-guanine dinucleotide biosynthesis protein A|nr:molybdenum cofactor guanylyltransferase [Candidatus Cybelea sp.]